jgi:hypothetical protein
MDAWPASTSSTVLNFTRTLPLRLARQEPKGSTGGVFKSRNPRDQLTGSLAARNWINASLGAGRGQLPEGHCKGRDSQLM